MKGGLCTMNRTLKVLASVVAVTSMICSSAYASLSVGYENGKFTVSGEAAADSRVAVTAVNPNGDIIYLNAETNKSQYEYTFNSALPGNSEIKGEKYLFTVGEYNGITKLTEEDSLYITLYDAPYSIHGINLLGEFKAGSSFGAQCKIDNITQGDSLPMLFVALFEETNGSLVMKQASLAKANGENSTEQLSAQIENLGIESGKNYCVKLFLLKENGIVPVIKAETVSPVK